MKYPKKVFLAATFILAVVLTCVVFGAENMAPSIVSAPYAVPAAVAVGGNADLCVLAADDQLPSGVLTYTWSKVSGPGNATFGANNGGAGGAVCPVSVDAPGSYKFAVNVSDGALSTTGEVAVEVAAANDAGSRASIGVPLENFVTLSRADDRMAPTAYEPGRVPGEFLLNRSDFSGFTSVLLRISGNAVVNTDYTLAADHAVTVLNPTLANVVLFPGEPFLFIRVIPIADTLVEGNETVTVSVIATNQYQTIAGSNSINVTISELPQVSVVTRAHAAEPSQPGKFDILRSGGSGALTVHYTISGTATAGADYTALPGSVTIPAGASFASVFVNVRDDSARETTETVRMTLKPNSKYALKLDNDADTLKLRDNDNPTVIVFDVNNEASEPGTNTGGVTFKRYGNLTAPLTINYSIAGSATNGVDYVSLSRKVTFAAGADLASIQIKVKDDTLREGDEDVVIQTAPGAGYQIESGDMAYIRIIDND